MCLYFYRHLSYCALNEIDSISDFLLLVNGVAVLLQTLNLHTENI